MPLAAAYPIMKSAIEAAITPKILSISKDAFAEAMEAMKDVSAKENEGNEGKDVFSSALDAAADAFSSKMSELGKEIAGAVADQVNTYTTQALITVPPGALVVTAGSPAAQAGSVTTPAIAVIS
jgi:hypothetical protein